MKRCCLHTHAGVVALECESDLTNTHKARYLVYTPVVTGCNVLRTFIYVYSSKYKKNPTKNVHQKYIERYISVKYQNCKPKKFLFIDMIHEII